jgi:signal transduction histidine kinase
MTRLSPYHALIGSSIVVVLVLVLCMGMALKAPTFSPNIEVDGDRVLMRDQHSSQVVTEFYTPQGMVVARPQLLLEEPDVLPTYAEFNQFMSDQQQLYTAAMRQQLYAVTDRESVLLTTEYRRWQDLPWMFWFQLFVGAAGALTGAAIYAFSQKNAATRYYALTGLGYLLFAPSAAIYSTRDFVISGELFRILSAINHFGALFFTASLVALLWHYPSPIRRWPVPACAYGAALIFWLMDMLQWWPDATFVPLSVLILFSAGILIAGVQGWMARRRPVARASFRWFIVSIFLGTGLFAGFVIIPTALNHPMPISQGLMFGAFLLMYWGLALGLLRYRLFELEAWWFSIWSWFLSGLSIIIVDILLVTFLSVSNQNAAIIAVALIGWVYFPVRQWVLQRIRRDARQNIDQWLPSILPLLLDVRLGSDQERQIRQRWPQILQVVFEPLHMSRQAGQQITSILQSGQQLLVPDLRSDHSAPQMLRLHHAARGQRLFVRHDLKTMHMLLQLAELALSVARARDTGARLERERIARDIHDDLGARLLYLLQKSTPDQQGIVRETLDDLRHLLNSLDGEEISLGEALANWRLETSKRTQATSAKLIWDVDVDEERILSAFEYHHLTRMLREAVTNAFKHSQPSLLRVAFYHPSPEQLAIDIHNDGMQAHPYQSHGRGLQNMQRRAQSLNGLVTWQQDREHHILIRVRTSHYDAIDQYPDVLESQP